MLVWTVIVVCIAFLWWKYARPHRYPPGPPMLPVVGSIPYLVRYRGIPSYKILGALAERYGNVFSFAYGSRKSVVLTGFETIKHALVDLPIEFAGRPCNDFRDRIRGNPRHLGIGKQTYTAEWKAQRNVALYLLKSLGFGHNTTEEKILEECRALIDVLDSSAEQPFNPQPTIHLSITNVICYLLWGTRFEHNDQKFHKFLKLMSDYVEELFRHQDVDNIPLVRYLPRGRRHLERYRNMFTEIDDFVEEKNSREILALEDGKEPRNFVQAYMQELQNPTTKLSEDWLKFLVLDFFLAGSDTTSTTLTWALLYMIKYPDIQSKVHQEIDRVLKTDVGRTREVRLSDREKMPYTHAVIMEVHRHSCFIPVTLPHMTTDDVELEGLLIPKGTQILLNLWQTTRDESIWDDPERFKPERFIDEKGELIRRKEWIPFGLGRRSCLGEQFARQEVFLYFTSVLQTFDLRSTVPLVDLDISPYFTSIVLLPKTYRLSAVRRNKQTA